MIPAFVILISIFSTNLLIYVLLKNSNKLIFWLYLIHNLGYVLLSFFLYLILQDWVEAEKIDFNATRFQLFGNILANIVLVFGLVMILSPFIYKLMKKFKKI